jgi:hypothetical protein
MAIISLFALDTDISGTRHRFCHIAAQRGSREPNLGGSLTENAPQQLTAAIPSREIIKELI